jgi:hypothetical protein
MEVVWVLATVIGYHRIPHDSGGQRVTELNVRLIDLTSQTVSQPWEHKHMTCGVCFGIAKVQPPPPVLDHHSPIDSAMTTPFDLFLMTWQ